MIALLGSQTGGGLQYCGFSHERGRRSRNEKVVEILTRPGAVLLILRSFLVTLDVANTLQQMNKTSAKRIANNYKSIHLCYSFAAYADCLGGQATLLSIGITFSVMVDERFRS